MLHQDKFLSSYIFYIEYLNRCFTNFQEEKKIKNREEIKLKKESIRLIKNHTDSLKQEMNEIATRTQNIKFFMYKLFEKVIGEFIKTLYEINTITKKESNSYASGFNTPNNKDKSILEEALKFRTFIFILEGILDELLDKFKDIDKMTTKLFIIGRFNNFLAIFDSIKKEVNLDLNEFFTRIGLHISFTTNAEDVTIRRIMQDFNSTFNIYNTSKASVFNETYVKKVIEEKGFNYTSPDFSDLRWWVKLKEAFNKKINPTTSHDVRLYMLCVKKNIGNKWQKFTIASNDVVLLDVFSCAQSLSGEKLVVNDFLQVREEVGTNGYIKDTRYLTSKNTIINLTPFLRKFDDFIAGAQ